MDNKAAFAEGAVMGYMNAVASGHAKFDWAYYHGLSALELQPQFAAAGRRDPMISRVFYPLMSKRFEEANALWDDLGQYLEAADLERISKWIDSGCAEVAQSCMDAALQRARARKAEAEAAKASAAAVARGDAEERAYQERKRAARAAATAVKTATAAAVPPTEALKPLEKPVDEWDAYLQPKERKRR